MQNPQDPPLLTVSTIFAHASRPTGREYEGSPLGGGGGVTLKHKTASYLTSKNQFVDEELRVATRSKQATAKPPASQWLSCGVGRKKPSFLQVGTVTRSLPAGSAVVNQGWG